MITIYDDFEKVNKQDLFTEVDQVLTKRADLWERYSRGISFETTGTVDGDIKDVDGKKLQVLFEKFIVDLAAGYLSGEITYNVDVSSDVEKKIGTRLFGKQAVDKQYADELLYILYTLGATNNDTTEKIKLFRQTVLFGSTYERILEDKNNYLKYYNLDALNTVAVWNNKMDPEVVAVIAKFEVKKDNNTVYYYRVYTAHDIRIYQVDNAQEVKVQLLDDNTREHNWGRVPVVVYESEFSILDRCEALINAYEALLNNVKNTYQYNDTDCKMKISGFRAQNPVMIPNPEYDPNEPSKKDKPKMIINPDRIMEDNYVLSSKTFYTEEGGDAAWLTKPVSAGDVTTMLKYYVDSIFQMCGIPNTADLAFNSGDLNASAIDRKFYVMNIMMSEIKDGVKELIYERFEALLSRVNTKLGKNYAMENVTISIATNLPSMQDENIDQMMRLNGIVSEKTILEKLGYDFETEQQNKEEEGKSNEAMGKTKYDSDKDDEEDGEETEGTDGTDTTTGEVDKGEGEEV